MEEGDALTIVLNYTGVIACVWVCMRAEVTLWRWAAL